MRIRARAIRRCGELLKEIEKKQAGRPEKISGGGATNFQPSPRSEAAKNAGLSKDQAVRAVRVSNVPQETFLDQVESDDPAPLAREGHPARSSCFPTDPAPGIRRDRRPDESTAPAGKHRRPRAPPRRCVHRWHRTSTQPARGGTGHRSAGRGMAQDARGQLTAGSVDEGEATYLPPTSSGPSGRFTT